MPLPPSPILDEATDGMVYYILESCWSVCCDKQLDVLDMPCRMPEYGEGKIGHLNQNTGQYLYFSGEHRYSNNK
jgi:hypothetical protein